VAAIGVAACASGARLPSVTTSPAPAPRSAAPVGPASSAPDGGRGTQASATGNTITNHGADGSDTLVEAVSGRPGDGATVEPHRLAVTNDDDRTLRLTWAGGPCDAADTLSIDATRRQFLLVEPECPGDSVIHDRVLILRFSEPIAATDIVASLQDGLDTPS
jgi:hypothetical protein